LAEFFVLVAHEPVGNNDEKIGIGMADPVEFLYHPSLSALKAGARLDLKSELATLIG